MIQAAFPKPLRSQIAFDIAGAIRDGFGKRYRLFRQTSRQAKRHFERGAWSEAQHSELLPTYRVYYPDTVGLHFTLKRIITNLQLDAPYPVGPHDVFPEQFGAFLLGHAGIRNYFTKHHADLLTPAWWQARKQRIIDGHVEDVLPYPQHIRFCNRHATPPAAIQPPFMETLENE